MIRILFISISYSENKSNIYNDLVNELVSKGHHVTVVSSATSSQRNSENYRILGFQDKMTGNINLIKKGINTLLIGRKFNKVISQNLYNDNFDLILYATPPITLNSTVKYCKKKYNAKTYLMLKDIFPQNAVDLSMIKKSNPIYWYFRKQEKELYKISDYIGGMSQGNIDYLLKHNSFVDINKIGIFYNAISINHSVPIKIQKNYETIFIFGGNLGEPQNILGLLRVIDKLSDFKPARFIIVGSGSKDYKIKDFIKQNNSNNLTYYSHMPKEEYEELLQNADIGLISLDPRFTIPNIPSKLPTYMNMKKPVLAITDTNTDLKNIINESGCGWWCNASELDDIIKTIKYICENKKEQYTRGINGYEYLCKYYDVSINVRQIEDFMEEQNESI